MKNWLFPQRIGRRSWFFRMVLVMGIFIPIILVTSPDSPSRELVPEWLLEAGAGAVSFLASVHTFFRIPISTAFLLEALGWAAALFSLVYTLIFIHLPRARSLGLHGGSLVLLIVPVGNILLLMMFLLGSEGYWTRITQQRNQG